MLNSIENINLYNKKVFIRLDLNVPIKKGIILSNKRIKMSIPTIKLILSKGAKIILATHLGRPKEGVFNIKYSVLPIVKFLEKEINVNIKLISDYLNNSNIIDLEFKYYNILMLENVRFNIGECKNDIILSKKYGSMCDIFVMDAFATAHRIHSSTYGISNFVNEACIGLLFENEIKSLSKIIYKPKRPLVSIVGGAKISTKFKFLNSLAKISDFVIVGGGISNTFLALNNNIGKSLYEKNFIKLAEKLLFKYNNIPLPVDCRVGKEFSELSKAFVKNINNILYNEEIMDLGDLTIKNYCKIIKNSKTILWNGPLGVFEFINFRKGTKSIAKAVISSKAYSVIGGGDTISALELFKLDKKVSYISTGGGAFLQFIENKTLPILELKIFKKN